MLEQALKIIFAGPLYLFRPEYRVWLPWLLTSALLALFWWRFFQKQPINFRKLFFNPRYWWNPSTRMDYVLFLLNPALLVLFITLQPWDWKLSRDVSVLLIRKFGFVEQTGLSRGLLAVFCTVTLTMADDLSRYLLHRALHVFPWLWEFHKVHHSASVLTPLTQYRIHPVEKCLFALRNFLILSLVTGCFLYLFPARFALNTVLGVNLFRFVFNLLGANLRHSHIAFSFGPWLEYLLISPFQHQIHHSNDSRFYNKNYGSQFALWDWFFGSLVRAKELNGVQLRFGINRNDMESHKSIKGLLFKPFRNILKRNDGN